MNEILDEEIKKRREIQRKQQNLSVKELVESILKDVPRKTGADLLPSCTKEKQNFVYIKNHKCASDTLSVVFRRFGFERDLSVVQPMLMKFNIGWPKPLHPGFFRASKSGHFNILTDHTVYNETFMDKLMSPGTVYMTSIREPFSHLKSSFNFFNVPKLGHISEKLQPGEDALMYFLQNKDAVDQQYKDPKTYKARPCVPPYLSVVRNMMAFDLGLPVGYEGSPDMQKDIPYIKQWLAHIDKKFETVRIFLS